MGILTEVAKLLNGRECGDEISSEILEKIKGNNLVVVFGYSDDLMEFRGAIYDEVGCYDGGTAYLNDKGLIQNECGSDDCPYYEQSQFNATTIEAIWTDEGAVAWTYKTDIPHKTFEIVEDGEVFCRGIIFRLADVK